MKDKELAEGWLNRQMEIVRSNVAEWPAYLKRAAGIADAPETKREAWDNSNKLEEFLTEQIHVFNLLFDQQITPRKAIESLACYRAGNVPSLPADTPEIWTADITETRRLEHGQGAQWKPALEWIETACAGFESGLLNEIRQKAASALAAPPEQPQGSGETHVQGCVRGCTGVSCDCSCHWPSAAQGQMSAREFYETWSHENARTETYDLDSGWNKEGMVRFAEAFARSQGAAAPSLPSAEEVKNRVRAIATKLEVYATMLREEFCKPTNGIAASQALSSDKVSKEENNNG